MKIFLTGGTGFVGSHFLNQALAAGHEVVALRRRSSTPRLALPCQPVWVDGQLDTEVSMHLAGADVLVHMAAHTPNVPYDTLERCLYWNVAASIGLAEQAFRQGVGKYLVAGTCFEYGRAAARFAAIPTNCPLEPDLSYPTSKAAAAVAFEGFARQNNVALKYLRIFQVYGEGEEASRLWPSLRAAALTGRDFKLSSGEQVRDFIPVEEVAAQFVRALDFSDAAPGAPVIRHVATGRAQSLRQFAEHWWKHWGASGKLMFGVVPYRLNEMMRIVPKI